MLKDLLIGIKNMQYDYVVYIFLIQVLLYFLFKKKLLKSVIKFRLVDRPGKYKIHKKNTPVTGGLIIFASLILYLFFSYFENNLINTRIIILFFGVFFVFLIGIIDDIMFITPQKKIIVITLFNILLFQNIDFFKTEILIFDNFLISENISIISLSLFISIFSFLGYHYSLVIIDGINGLFGAYIIVLLLILLIYFNLDYEFKNLILYLILSLLFVTALNINGDLFLGNSGSLMLGTFVPYLLICIYNIRETSFSIFIFISLVIIPISDMVRLFFIRILNRKSPFQKDLKHFHHLLIARYPLHITLILYLMLCFFPFIIINHFKIDALFVVMIQIATFFTLSFYLKKIN